MVGNVAMMETTLSNDPTVEAVPFDAASQTSVEGWRAADPTGGYGSTAAENSRSRVRRVREDGLVLLRGVVADDLSRHEGG